KERLAKLQDDLQQRNAQEHQDKEIRQLFSRLEEFADHIKAGLITAGFDQRREILRALVKRVELDKDSLRIVYKVPPRPFATGPQGGLLLHCLYRPYLRFGPRPMTPLRGH